MTFLHSVNIPSASKPGPTLADEPGTLIVKVIFMISKVD